MTVATIVQRRRFSDCWSFLFLQRLEVLAALESAFQDHLPVSLRLAQVDRDFNE